MDFTWDVFLAELPCLPPAAPLASSVDEVRPRIPTGFVWLIPVMASFSRMDVTGGRQTHEGGLETCGTVAIRGLETGAPL
jgi:hypothetical protein